MNRVAGETDTVTDLEGRRQFPKCLLITLSGGPNDLEFNTKIHRGDALCVVDEDDPEHSLTGRVIGSGQSRTKMNRDWLASCDDRYSATFRPCGLNSSQRSNSLTS